MNNNGTRIFLPVTLALVGAAFIIGYFFPNEMEPVGTGETRSPKAVETRSSEEIFLEKNQSSPGTHTLPSGLQYRIIRRGNGKTPNLESTILVHYRGRLLNGAIFDTTYHAKSPRSFPLKNMIPGWIEGLQLMKEGGKREFFVPSKLAYGKRGAGNLIPPNSMLMFTIELVRVE